MADPARRRSRARLRTALGWVLTLTIVLYSIVDWGDDDDDRIAAAAGDGDGDDKLRIRTISDAEVSPGDAVVVRFDNADDDLPIGARVAGEAATILDSRAHSLVVRIPDDVATGDYRLRLELFDGAGQPLYQADLGPLAITQTERVGSAASSCSRVGVTVRLPGNLLIRHSATIRQSARGGRSRKRRPPCA